MNLNRDLIPSNKINSKWITHLYVKSKTLKLIEKNLRENLDELEYGDDFIDTIPETEFMKERINMLIFNKFKISAQ